MIDKSREESLRWIVRFATRDGMFHPVWFSNLDGRIVTRSEANDYAEKYLFENRSWLDSIDEIRPFK